jgi:hypothetical protein
MDIKSIDLSNIEYTFLLSRINRQNAEVYKSHTSSQQAIAHI